MSVVDHQGAEAESLYRALSSPSTLLWRLDGVSMWVVMRRWAPMRGDISKC
jgi:hypothetical protein